MTDQTPIEEGIILPSEIRINLPAVLTAEAFFNKPDAVEEAIAKIEAAVRGHVPDLSTRKGRDAIASLAYRVSKSKTYLDGEGKKLVDGIKAQAAVIDKSRKSIRDRLDALRDEARKPLDDWEAAEQARQDRDKAILASLKNHGMTGHESSVAIVAKAHEIRAIELPEDFGGDVDFAKAAKAGTMQALRNMFTAAQAREAEAAELVKLRAEAEARRAREAEELAAREAAEAAARQERERAEAAEQARKDAEVRAAEEIERAKREAAEAVERAQQEAADEIARERERAAQIERERQEEDDRQRQAAEEEAKRKADEQAALEADEARRVEVMGAIEAALAAMTGRATPRAIAEALMAGEIPHIQVVL